jgi:hypothetical protein
MDNDRRPSTVKMESSRMNDIKCVKLDRKEEFLRYWVKRKHIDDTLVGGQRSRPLLWVPIRQEHKDPQCEVNSGSDEVRKYLLKTSTANHDFFLKKRNHRPIV